MYCINYIYHLFFLRETKSERYDLDQSNKNSSLTCYEQCKRLSLVALPLLELYNKSLGLVLSVEMGGCRIFSYLSKAMFLAKIS